MWQIGLFIIKRWDAELQGLTGAWNRSYTALSEQDRFFVDRIVDTNAFDASMWKNQSPAVCKVLKFYTIAREDIKLAEEAAKLRVIADFEKSCSNAISAECRRLLSEAGADRE